MYLIVAKDKSVFYKTTLNKDFNLFVADSKNAKLFSNKKNAEKSFKKIKRQQNYEIVEVKGVR